MTGRIFSSLGRRAIRAAASLALAGCTAAVVATPASAMCSNATRTVHFIEFPEGSDALPPNLKAAFDARLSPDLAAGRYVDSYTILASGDLGEGEEWDGAAADARAADRRLGERRAAALEAMVREGASPPLGADRVRVTVRENPRSSATSSWRPTRPSTSGSAPESWPRSATAHPSARRGSRFRSADQGLGTGAQAELDPGVRRGTRRRQAGAVSSAALRL